MPSRAISREYTASTVAVIVVDVGRVRVLVLDGARRVGMAVRLRPFPALVGVLVVFVVDVHVRVRPRRVAVVMQVALLNQQPRGQCHERRRREQAGGQRLAEQDQAARGAEERRRRKLGAGARRAELAHREDEEDEARPVAHRAEGKTEGDRAR